MKTRTLKMPDVLDRQVDEFAARKRVSRSVVVREAIEAYLLQGEKPERPCVLAVVRDLAGCLEGPPDLSHNERHLQDYGADATSANVGRKQRATRRRRR